MTRDEMLHFRQLENETKRTLIFKYSCKISEHCQRKKKEFRKLKNWFGVVGHGESKCQPFVSKPLYHPTNQRPTDIIKWRNNGWNIQLVGIPLKYEDIKVKTISIVTIGFFHDFQ